MSKKVKRTIDRVFQVILGFVFLGFGTWITVSDLMHDNTHMLVMAPIIAVLWFCPKVCKDISICRLVEVFLEDFNNNWRG